MKKSKSTGQASLVLILILGLVAMLSVLSSSSLSVSNVQVEQLSYVSDQAWYAAWGAVDELMYRLRAKQNFGASYQIDLTFPNGATASAIIQGDSTQKIVTAIGYSQDSIRRLEVKVASSSSKASFIFAAQSGEGGFELEGNSTVIGLNNTPGNVYSNGSVLGIRASTGQSGSKVLGSVWAVNNIGGLNSPSTGGVYIQQDARAGSLTACLVGGNVTSPQPPTNCPYSGALTLGPAPQPVPLASVDAQYWKDQAQAGGVWSGNCTIGAGDGTDCTAGTNNLGSLQILGNLSIPSGTNPTITGPVWVKGDFNVSQNNTLYTDEAAGKNSLVIIASNPDNPANQGRIVTSSNVQFNLNSQGAGLIFISENLGDNCSTAPAIDITSNTATVVFVAQNGCINIGSNSLISGVLGKKVHISNNSTIQYDPNLAQAIVAPDSGGWAVTSVREY